MTVAFTKPASPGIEKHYKVMLYSAGKVLGTWEAPDIGIVEGQSLTFSVGNEIFARQVRISGTYTVEKLE